jgi:uncharacterized protein (UPF0303 family)
VTNSDNTDLTELIAKLEEQERRLVFTAFDNDEAWRLGNVLTDLARARRLPVAIDIRRNGQQLFHVALDGATADNDAWILRKSRVVDRYSASSYLVGLQLIAEGTTFEENSRLDPNLYAAKGGAFPITVAGTGVVGTVAVSGLPAVEDHALVVAALEAHLGKPAPEVG